LILNLLGTVLLFVSFQATSSNFRLITASDGRAALCIDQRVILVADAKGLSFSGGGDCPKWGNARPAAVVNFEQPVLVTIGFALLTMGFLLQVVSIPRPRTVAQLRAEIKAAELAEKSKVSKN
jgi:hypothetical protein